MVDLEKLYYDAFDIYNAGNVISAVKQWKKAALQGHASSMNILGVVCEERDYDNAVAYYRLAARLGEPCAMNNLARLYYDRKNYKKAVKWWMASADLGGLDNIDEKDVQEMRKFADAEGAGSLDLNSLR